MGFFNILSVFRAASELFAPLRKLERSDMETLRLVVRHQRRKVPSRPSSRILHAGRAELAFFVPQLALRTQGELARFGDPEGSGDAQPSSSLRDVPPELRGELIQLSSSQ